MLPAESQNRECAVARSEKITCSSVPDKIESTFIEIRRSRCNAKRFFRRRNPEFVIFSFWSRKFRNREIVFFFVIHARTKSQNHGFSSPEIVFYFLRLTLARNHKISDFRPQQSSFFFWNLFCESEFILFPPSNTSNPRRS